MEKAFVTSTTSSDGAQQHPFGHGVPADDNGGSDDQPPIPSAGSSSVLNEKGMDGARTPTTYRTNETTAIVLGPDMGEVHEWAHTTPIESVLETLETNAE